MNPDEPEPEQPSGDDLLGRSRELIDRFAILTRLMKASGFVVGSDALAMAGISRPQLHQLYSHADGVAAFGEGPADDRYLYAGPAGLGG